MIIRSSHIRRRRGAVAVLVAISLTVLLMVLGIALDVGLMFSERRLAQATADAAALAGAADLYQKYKQNVPIGRDSSGSAATLALDIAKANGYDPATGNAAVVVRTADATFLGGPRIGELIPAGQIEVTVTHNFQRRFSLIFGSDTIPIKARAVAAGTWGPVRFGLLTLGPTGVALKLGGQGTVNVTTGIIAINSSDSGAVTNQNNATLIASEVNILGSLTGAGTIITSPVPNNVNYGVPANADPLATLPVPAQPADGSITTYNTSSQDGIDILANLVAKGTITAAQALTITSKIYVLEPGSYGNTNPNKLPSGLGNGDLVIFKQASAGNGGIYYLNEGGFSSNGANLLMDPDTSGGMMFYNNGTANSDKISITGNSSGVVNLSALTSGTYQGIMLFQNRLATQDISITGNGSFNMNGTIYAANADLGLTGNGSSQTIGSALISKSVTLSGNGIINVSFSGGQVAPQRILRLME